MQLYTIEIEAVRMVIEYGRDGRELSETTHFIKSRIGSLPNSTVVSYREATGDLIIVSEEEVGAGEKSPFRHEAGDRRERRTHAAPGKTAARHSDGFADAINKAMKEL